MNREAGTRIPRSPRIIRILDFYESVYMDASIPTTERLAAATAASQILGFKVDVLITGPNVWRDGLVRLRARVYKTNEFKRRRRKRKAPDIAKALQQIRKYENGEGQ